MAFTTYGFRAESESDIDNEVPLYLSGANKQAISRIAPSAADGGVDVYADELVQEHLGGKIFRMGYKDGAGTIIYVADITSEGAVFNNVSLEGSSTLHYTGPALFDVEAYGAVGDGVTDDTDAIQACIDAAKEAIGTVAESHYYGAVVRFNAYYYAVSALDCTMMHNTLFLGMAGPGGTNIRGVLQTAATHGAGGKAVFDAAATSSCRFDNFLVDATSIRPGCIAPMAGFLFAGTGNQGVNCVANRMRDCGSFGAFQVAPLVMTYSGAHMIEGSGFQQYAKDRPCILVGDEFPTGHGVLTSLVGDAASPHPYTFPPLAPASGGGTTTFVACEAHHMPASGGETPPYTAGSGSALSVEKCQGLVWLGGILASYGATVVRVGGASRGIALRPTTAYSDEGAHRPLYVLGVAGGAVVDALEWQGGLIDSIPANGTSGAFINIAPNATVDKLIFRGYSRGGVPATGCYAISSGGYSSSATEAISGLSEIDCDGLDVNMHAGGNGPSIGRNVSLVDCGTLTMDPAAHNYSPVVQPSALATRSADWPIANGSFTAIDFQSATEVTDNLWDVSAPSRLTIRTAGVYDLTAACRFAANPTGGRYLGIYKNGGTALIDTWLPPMAATAAILALSAPGVALAAGDYLQIIPSQDSGGSLNALAAGGNPSLYVRRRKE